MSAFRKGMRVAVYGGAGKHVLEGIDDGLFLCGSRGRVISSDRHEAPFSKFDILTVKMDGKGIVPKGHIVEVHSLQCVRLIKRGKK